VTAVRALSLCLLWVLTACAGRLDGPTPLTRAKLERHAALAPDDHRGRARFAAELGLGGDAIFHAERWLEQARARVLIGKALDASPTDLRNAQRDLKHAAAHAIDVGRRFDDGALVLDGALAQRRPDPRDLAWGCEHADYWGGDPVPLLEHTEADPTAWVAAWTLLSVSDWGLESLEERGYTVPSAVLRKLDARGNDVRWAQLRRALQGGALSQRAVELAATIAKHDPSDLRARLLLELREAMMDGSMVQDADLLGDQTADWVPVSHLSRARRRAETFTEAPAAQLHYAQLLLSRGLSGDALAVLERAEGAWTSDTQRDIASLIEGLAQLRAGRPEAYDEWRTHHDGAAALYADRSLKAWHAFTLGGEMLPSEDSPLGKALLDAVLRRVTARDPSLVMNDLVQAWASGDLGRRDRGWVRARIGVLHPLVADCLDRDGKPDDCATLVTRPYQTASWAIADRGLTDASANTLVRWADVPLLGEDGWKAIEAARETTLALSSSFTSVYVRGLLLRGEFEAADAWLQRFGASLSPENLAGLQLTLADHLSGRVEPESSGRGFSRFESAWPGDTRYVSHDEVPEADPRAPWPQKMYMAGQAVNAGLFERAETVYVELAEGVPAPARSLALGLAARAAFEAGHPAAAKGHLTELSADDPARLQVEALLAGAEGNAERARALLVRAWPHRRSAAAHLLRLGVSMQTASGLEALVEHGTLPWSLENAVRTGSIGDLSTLASMLQLHDDPAQAWEQADTVLPELLPGAIQFGNERLRATRRADDARPIAAKLIALHQRRPHPPRDTVIELMLLTGQHAEALSLARSEIPEEWIVPLESTHALVRLHTAARDGSISTEALWDEWRWRAGIGDEAKHQALLGKAKGPLLGYACMLLSDTPGDARALPTCKRAWEAEREQSWQSAVNYSFVLLQQDVPPPEALAQLFTASSPPPYNPAAPPLRDRADVAVLHQNLGAWLSMGNEDERAAHARLDAYAYARWDDKSDNDVLEAEYGVRGEHARAGTLSASDTDAATALARAAYQALRGLQPDVARHYARVSAALPEDKGSIGGPLAAAQVAALAPLLSADVEAKRAPAAVLGDAVSTAFDSAGALEVLAPLHDKHPDSLLVRALLAEADTADGRFDLALKRLEPVEAAHATNPFVAVIGARARLGADDPGGAKARFAAAIAAHPESALLRYAELPESIAGARPGIPAWLRTADAYDERLQSLSTEDLMGLVPRYRSHTEVAADAFFPLAWDPREDDPLSARGPEGEWVSLTQDARASRCVGEECVRDLLDSLTRRGYTLHFTRTTALPVGEATEATLSDATSVWVVTSVPVGGRVFTLLGSAQHDRADAMLEAFALLRRSFAPLDGVLPAFAVASLRADGATLVDRFRLKARLEAATAGGDDCPAPKALADASPAAAAEVLLDLYLSNPTPKRRKQVLQCAKGGDRIARRLALATLLDDDASVHAWGRTAVDHHPSRAIRDAKHLLPMDIPLSTPDYFDRDESAPRGRIELGLALPERAARRWLDTLLSSADEAAVVDAWVIASQRPSVVDVEVATRTARDAEPGIAFLALDVLERVAPAAYATTLRARFDALDPVALAEDELWQGRALGFGLVELADAADGPRLRRAAKRFEGDSEAHKDAAKSLRKLAQWHAEMLAGDPTSADPFNAAQRARTKAARKPRSAAQLETLPLPKLLPTRHWTFARVASPGLFASTVLDLTRRLDPGDPTQRLLVSRAVETMRQSNGFDALLEGGGLDLSAPIECASMAGDSGFVCSATVLDQGALLTELGHRGYDSDAGLAIVLQLSKGAGLLPVGLSALPVFMHELVYGEPDKDEDDEDEDPVERRYQRLRHRVDIAGHDLHYYAIIEAEEGSVGTDAERYLFVGDRVLVFSNDFMARRVLFEPTADATSLGDDPEFVALTRDWKDGSALQAAAMGMSSLIDDASIASEVVADGKGIAFRYSATTDAKLGDMSNAQAHLPPGAVSTLVVGFPKQDDADDDLPELTERKLASGDVVPPVALLAASEGAAFGWYPAPGDGLWRQWAMVFPHGAALRKAARALGVRRPSGTAKQTKAGWWYGEVDDLLIVASTEQLAKLALARPSVPSSTPYLLGRGTFEGERASKVVARLPFTDPELERMLMRFFAAIVGLVEDVGFEATWDPKTRVGRMEGRVSLRLRDLEGSEVVDRWLAAARFRNAAELPRTLSATEAEGTLRFTVRVGDAKAFIDQSVYPSARVTARATDDTHVELTVRAKARDAEANETLSKARSKALLDTSDDLRIHDNTIESVRDTLTKPSMDNTAKAKAITEWVHERIDYEVTPRSLDATQILEVGRGDCSEYARLSVALLRSAGVPAEVRSGMAAQAGDMVAHAWVAYHDGKRWHEVDPTWGRMSVTAGHLPLEVTDVLALISLGQLEIVTIDSVK